MTYQEWCDSIDEKIRVRLEAPCEAYGFYEYLENPEKSYREGLTDEQAAKQIAQQLIDDCWCY